MKSLKVLIGAVLMACVLMTTVFAPKNARAARAGVDERIHMCISEAGSKRLGDREKFRMHIVADQYIQLTRLSDKKRLKADYNGSAYIFKGDATPQSLIGKRKSGYMFDVNSSGELTVAFGVGPGTYESERLSCKLVRQVRSLEPLSETEAKLVEIGDGANVANGSYETSKFDLNSFDLKKEQAELDRLRKGWPGCKWQRETDRATIYKLMDEEAYDPDTTKRVKALESKPGLFNIIALISDSEIQCSQRYFLIYTADGYKLSLLYSQGD